jgi:hypothetical protein
MPLPLLAGKAPPVEITGIKPGIFFKEVNTELHQLVDIGLQSDGKYANLTLLIESKGYTHQLTLAELSKGTDTISFLMPDLRDTTEVNFSLMQGETQLASYNYDWIPVKHWDLYMVHSSHHDLGYTDLPNRVLEEHKDHITQAIRYCEMTEDWPEASRFHYVVEQAWSAAYFMEHTRDEVLKDKFIHYLKNGQLEITALFGNQNTDMSATEELNRLVYPSFALAERYGFEVNTAETNDMPGIHWGLVSVLHQAGVRYLYAGIQDYFKWGDTMPAPWDEEKVMRRDISGAFYWQGPDDHQVMFWYGGGSLDNIWVWEYEQAKDELQAYLQNHQEKGYPYDMLLVRVLGGYRDNSLPDMRHSEIVKQWNEEWAYPRIRFSNNKQFFTSFEEAYGHILKTIRGDFNQTDYNIGAISTPKETASHRDNQRQVTVAETFASLASQLTDYAYPRDQINESYERLFLYNEHCWGLQHPTGLAQRATNSQKANHAFQAGALIEDLTVKATNKIADQVALDDDGYYFVVFNPLSVSRSDIVKAKAYASIPAGKPFFRQQRQMGKHEVSIWRAGEAADRKLHQLPNEMIGKPFRIVDVSNGKTVPHQLRKIDDPLLPLPDAASRLALSQVSQTSTGGLNYQENQAVDILFFAEDVPALGYKTYKIEPLDEDKEQEIISAAADEQMVENEFYKLNFDQDKIQVLDKSSGRLLFDEEAAFNPAGIIVRSVADARVASPDMEQARITEHGPVYTTIEIRGSMDKLPVIVQQIRVYHHVKKIEVATRLLKDASPFYEYYIAFPFDMENSEYKLSAVNAQMEPIRDQLPGTNTDAYTVQNGISLSNDDMSIHWNSPDAPIVRLDKMWPGYVSQAHHGKTPAGYRHAFTDAFTSGHMYSLVSVNNFRTNFSPSYSGDMLFRYAISSQEGTYDAASAYQEQQQLAHPMLPVVIQGPQNGPLASEYSFLNISSKNVALVTLKAAEDGEGLVLRLRETAGEAVDADIRLNGIPVEEAAISNLQEVSDGALPLKEGRISISMQPYEIKTIRIKSGKSFPQNQHYFYSY